jgi:hypothetical protein
MVRLSPGSRYTTCVLIILQGDRHIALERHLCGGVSTGWKMGRIGGVQCAVQSCRCAVTLNVVRAGEAVARGLSSVECYVGQS